MKKLFFAIAVMCFGFGLASAKSLPKLKESNFGKDSYVESVISAYEMVRDNSIRFSRVYDRVERYSNGDNFVEIAEKQYKSESVIYVGMMLNGAYASRTWYEVKFPETTLDAAIYENSKVLNVGGSDGAYELGPDAELYYIFQSISFRTSVRNVLTSKYPEKITEKDAALSEVFTAFYNESARDQAALQEAVKQLQDITGKYKN